MSYRYIANDYLSPVSPEEILVTNRGFLYGEGAFTTILRQKNRPILWDEHREKLIQSWLQFYPKSDTASLRNRLNQNILKIQPGI